MWVNMFGPTGHSRTATGEQLPPSADNARRTLSKTRKLLHRLHHLTYDEGYGTTTEGLDPKARARARWKALHSLLIFGSFSYLRDDAVKRYEAGACE